MKPIKWGIIVLLMLFSKLAVQAVPLSENDLGAGDCLPFFSVTLHQGDTVSSKSLEGKPAVIVFFNTKCWDCRKELPVIQQLYETYGKDVAFLCISRAEPTVPVTEFWEKNGLSLPVSPQENKDIFRLFATKTIPRIYVCDDRGVIRKAFKEKVRKRKLVNAIESVILE